MVSGCQKTCITGIGKGKLLYERSIRKEVMQCLKKIKTETKIRGNSGTFANMIQNQKGMWNFPRKVSF